MNDSDSAVIERLNRIDARLNELHFEVRHLSYDHELMKWQNNLQMNFTGMMTFIILAFVAGVFTSALVMCLMNRH